MKLFKNINFDKLKEGLGKTRSKFVGRLNEVVAGKLEIDADAMDQVEEILVTSDIGYDTALHIIDKTQEALLAERRNTVNVVEIIEKELIKLLDDYKVKYTEYDKLELYKPFVILIVGVNGSGKTTTVGKLAHNYKNAGLSVMIGSADTFRAAANQQLEIWAERADVDLVQKEAGADPSSVVFETLSAAKKKNSDVVIIDTAGRLHTKNNLMQELGKIKKVISKVVPHAPNEIFLVIDGNTGQNALVQAREFAKVTELTGLIVTKLDGTAKGGVMFQLLREQETPVRYIGVGEGIDDLQTFDPEMYVSALFKD